MATVTGITAERAQEIEDASVVSGEISPSGHLLLTKHGGAEVDAGVVVPPPIASWPVGSIFLSVNPDNPATMLGGGTWVRWGQGRVPVSLDSAQTEFDTIEETGGAKTHVLTTPQMPSHTHAPGTLNITNSGNHDHEVFRRVNVGDSNGFAQGGGVSSADNGRTAVDGSHDHNINGNTGSNGGGAAHNIMQPYIVCYMWKRTA
jgi:hypothetical protein